MSIGGDLGGIGKKLKTGAKKVKKGLSKGLHVGHDAPGKAPGWVKKGAAAPFEAARNVAEAAHLDDAGNAVNKKALAPAGSWLDKKRTKYVSRPITTVTLEDSWNPKDWTSGSRWKSHWKEAEGISPGQSYAAGLGGELGKVKRKTGVDLLPGNTEALGQPTFDVRDPQQREVFKHGAAKLASGTTDAAASWFLAPEVGVLKGAVVAKKALITKPITKGTNVAKASESRRVNKVLEHAQSLPPDRRYAWAIKHPAMRGNSHVADLIAQAPDKEAMRLVLKSAMDGTESSKRQLQDRWKSGAIQVENIRDTRIPALEKELIPIPEKLKMNPTHPWYKGSPHEKNDKIQARLQAEKLNLENVEKDHRLDELLMQSAGSIAVVPRGTGKTLRDRKLIPGRKGGTVAPLTDEQVAATKVKDRAAAAKHATNHGGVTWFTYQPSKYNAPMRVLKSASTKRPGNVNIDEHGHAAEMARRQLDRAGHGLGKGIDPAVKDRLIGEVVKASNGKKEEVIAALEKVDSFAIHHNASLLGLHPEAVQAVIDRTFASRRAALEGVQGGEKGAFSGAKDAQGNWMDQVRQEDGSLVRTALFDTDLANSHQMTDLDRLTKVLRRSQHDMRGKEGKALARAINRPQGEFGMAGKAADTSAETLERFNRFWKTSVLFRLGYPPRVIADSELRSIAVLGATNAIPLSASSLKQGVATGNTAMRFKGMVGKKGRKEAAAKAAAMEPARAFGLRRQHIVDQLQTLTKNETEAAAKVAAAQDALSMPLSAGLRTTWSKTLAEARAEQQGHALERLHLTGKRDNLAEWTDEMNTDYMNHLDDAIKPKDRPRGTAKRPNKFSGTYKFRSGGQVVKAPDAGAGHLGTMWMDMAGFEDSARSLAGISPEYLNRMRIKAGQSTTITPLPPTKFDVVGVELHKETYDRAWERAVNIQIGKSPVGRLMLEGKSDEDVLRWLKKSPAGREVVTKLDSVTAHDLDEWVGRMRGHVDQYVPAELREQALKGIAKTDDLRAWYKAAGKQERELPVIHGDSLDIDMGEHANRDLLANFVDTAWRKLATTPTNSLANHPFFAGVYRREYKAQYKRLNLKPGDKITEDTQNQIIRRSRAVALRETKDNMYDLAGQSNLAHVARFVMPFYAPWADALKTWGKLWMDDPSRIARTAQVWNAPKKDPSSYQQNGETFWQVPLPKWAKNNLPINVGAPANSIRDLTFTGEYPYLPGFGPTVTVPAAALLRDRPDLAKAMEPLLPYGAGNSPADQVLPAGWRKLISRNQKEDDEDYSKTLVQMIYDVDVENETKDRGWGEEEMIKIAKDRTNAMYGLKAVGNLVLPFSPNYKSPGRLYIDAYREFDQQFRKDPHAFPALNSDGQLALDEEGKPQYLTAKEKFLYGQGGDDKGNGEDFFAYTQGITQGDAGQIPITDHGFRGFEQHKELIGKMPELAGLIVGDDPDGTFNSSVYEWMLRQRIPGTNTRVRHIPSAREAIADLQVQKGWSEYNRGMNAIQAAAIDDDLSIEELKAQKNAYEKVLRSKYPHWGESMDSSLDFGKMDRRALDMETMVNDPKLQGRAGFKTLAQYLATRRDVVAELQKRKAAGHSGNLQAEENGVLREGFEDHVDDLIRSDTKFEDIYNRWLSKDELKNAGEATASATPAERVTMKSPLVDRSKSWMRNTAPAGAPAAPPAPGTTPPVKATTPTPAAPATVTKGNLSSPPVSHNTDGSVSKLQTTTFVDNGQTVTIPYAGPDGKRLSKAEAIAQYKRTGKFIQKTG